MHTYLLLHIYLLEIENNIYGGCKCHCNCVLILPLRRRVGVAGNKSERVRACIRDLNQVP